MQNQELIDVDELPEAPIAAPDPDHPEWGFPAAFAVWIISVLLILFVPSFAVIIYAAGKNVAQTDLAQWLQSDKNAILVNLLAIIPAHILTIMLAVFVVTRSSGTGFFKAIGWDLGRFKIWHGFLIIFGFMVFSAVVGKYFPEEDNQLLRILKSSREATVLIGLVATLSAPFVEEVVYRGVLYSAARKSFGKVGAVVLVTSLFTLVHVPQYYPSYSTITMLLVLSLILTVVRARTGRLLPCFILHLIFNGLTSLFLIIQAFVPEASQQLDPLTMIVPQ